MCPPHEFSFEDFLDTFTYFQTETYAFALLKNGDPRPRFLIVSSLTFEGFSPGTSRPTKNPYRDEKH